MNSAESKSNSGRIIATLREVTVTFDGYQTRSLARVSLEVRRGEIFGVLGPKGAGKSTVLKLLAGQLKPADGDVKVFGGSLRWGSGKARIGYVPGKSDSDHPAGFFSRLFRRKRAAPQAAGRANLTQAVIGSRELIVLDDPFADATPAEKAELKTLLRELAGRGKTVVISADSLAETKDFCDTLAILHEGRLQAAGSLAELLASPFAIRFLAPVLPPALAGSIARILREQLGGESAAAQPAPAPATMDSSAKTPPSAEETRPAASAADQHLTPLTKPIAAAKPSDHPSGAGEAIDHGKLDELTKPARAE